MCMCAESESYRDVVNDHRQYRALFSNRVNICIAKYTVHLKMLVRVITILLWKFTWKLCCMSIHAFSEIIGLSEIYSHII